MAKMSPEMKKELQKAAEQMAKDYRKNLPADNSK